MSDAERKSDEAMAYNDYRLNLLAQAILQINAQANHPLLEPEYTFGEDYTEEEEEDCV